MTSKGYFALTGFMAFVMVIGVITFSSWFTAAFGVFTGGMLVMALVTYQEEQEDAEILALALERLGDEGDGKHWRMVFMDEDGNVME